jgi:predicted PurR-regulated permease PerM
MLGIDQRALKAAWTIFLFALAMVTIYAIRGALATFTLALFLALLLSPVVTFVDHFTSIRVPRTVALAVVYIALIAVFASALIAVGSGIASDARNLAGKLPVDVQGDLLSHVPLPGWLEPARERIGGWLHDRVDELGQNALALAGKAVQQLATGLGAIVSAVLVPILAFFFIMDGKQLRDGVIHGFPRHRQVLVHEILHDLHRLLSQYLRALVILSVVTFVFYSGFLNITGSHYAVLLGGIAAMLEFIPAVGPFVAMVAIVLVSAFSGYTQWLLLVAFFAVYRLALDYVLQPMLLSAGMRIHPLLIIFGVLAGGEIGGILGIFFSVPFIAALRMVLLRLWKQPHAD